jgi:hypothetical protein
LNYWQFDSFLCDLECDYEDLPYCTEMGWLSCHKVLRSFFDFRNEIILFLEMNEQNVSDIRSTKWILDLAFMVDIAKHLTELNLYIKGKINSSIYDNVKGFQTRLWLWKCQLKNGNVVCFKTCKSVFVQRELQLSVD